MKSDRNKFWQNGFAIFLLLAFTAMVIFPIYQQRREWNHRRQQFLDFKSAINPILRLDTRFQFVSVGAYTGGKSGCLGGFVGSTNDLEKLRTIYSVTLSNHPARVDFHVEIDEQFFR